MSQTALRKTKDHVTLSLKFGCKNGTTTLNLRKIGQKGKSKYCKEWLLLLQERQKKSNASVKWPEHGHGRMKKEEGKGLRERKQQTEQSGEVQSNGEARNGMNRKMNK